MSDDVLDLPKHVMHPEAFKAGYEKGLADSRAEAVKLLTPFAHDDLCTMFGGNLASLQGENIIYVRNGAILKLKHFNQARDFIDGKKIEYTGDV